MERSISEARFEADRIRMSWGNRITLEQSWTRFRRGEEEHAERGGDSGRHSSVKWMIRGLLYKHNRMIIDDKFSNILQNQRASHLCC